MRDDHGDPVAEACEQLAGYIPTLERLAGESPSVPGGPRAMLARPAFVPEPYHQAGRVLMDTLEGIRRLEASVRLATSGHPGPRRGMSDGNTEKVLAVLPKITQGLDEPGRRAAARYLAWRVRQAQSVPDIDEARRWRALPAWDDDGEPAECPYCGMCWLKVCMEPAPGGRAGEVRCFFADCPGDARGMRATAVMGTDERGRPCVADADRVWKVQAGT